MAAGAVTIMPGRIKRLYPAILLAFVVTVSLLSACMNARADETPTFLVSTPNMGDPLFEQSVIMMLPVTEPPLVVGYIINKPTAVPVHQLFPDAPTPGDSAKTAFFGGPVEPGVPSLVMRTSDAPAKAIHAFDGIYLSTSPDAIGAILKDSHRPKDLRVILGRAQWSEDQLHREIMEGSWYMVPAKAEVVFSSDPDHVWKTLVQHAQMIEVEATDVSPFTLLRCAAPLGTREQSSFER
jgi:putative transcriptional regulator